MATNWYCDGVRRRDFLKAGVLTPFGMSLSLSGFLRLSEARAADVKRVPVGKGPGFGKATSAIFINLSGGPTHLDTFDMKPDAPEEYRGEFRPIETSAPGVTFSEHLPSLAKVADKFAVLRGVSHSLAAHEFGTKYMNTGNRPIPSLDFPGYGAVVSKERPGPRDLPPFVAVPNTPQVAGYLGVEFAPFSTTNTPRAGQPFSVRGISLGRGVTVEEVEKRRALLSDLDTTFEGFEKSSDLVNGLDRFGQRAYDIISSPRSRKAFDVAQESASITGMFNASPIAQSCLLASRLVEAGVRFITVSSGGWDTHQNNFATLKSKLLPDLDSALSGLFRTLDQKGLLESTAVFVTGEFGRTPKVNARGGRDHYPRAMFVLMGGGGVQGGRVIGASDEKGMGPASGDGIAPDDVAASFYHALGVDASKEYQTPTGRPVAIVRNGSVISDLFV